MSKNHKGEVSVETGLGLPRHTTVSRLAYTPPAEGYVVYDTDLDAVYSWDGASWQVPAADTIYTADGTTGAGRAVTLTDTLAFDTDTLFIDGTNDRVGVGTASPVSQLHISGTSSPQRLTIENTAGGVGQAEIMMKSGSQEWQIFMRENDKQLGFYDDSTNQTVLRLKPIHVTANPTYKKIEVDAGYELDMGNTVANRRIVMYNSVDNDHEFYGFGINAATLRYQSDGSHAFYSAIDGTSSIQSLKLWPNAEVQLSAYTGSNFEASPPEVRTTLGVDSNGNIIKSDLPNDAAVAMAANLFAKQKVIETFPNDANMTAGVIADNLGINQAYMANANYSGTMTLPADYASRPGEIFRYRHLATSNTVIQTTNTNQPSTYNTGINQTVYFVATPDHWAYIGRDSSSNNNLNNTLVINNFNDGVEITGSVKIADGSEANGFVLTSDASGVATWQASGSPTTKTSFSPVVRAGGTAATLSTNGYTRANYWLNGGLATVRLEHYTGAVPDGTYNGGTGIVTLDLPSGLIWDGFALGEPHNNGTPNVVLGQWTRHRSGVAQDNGYVILETSTRVSFMDDAANTFFNVGGSADFDDPEVYFSIVFTIPVV